MHKAQPAATEKRKPPRMNDCFYYEVEGESTIGDETVLLEGNDNLIANMAWHREGYTVQPLLTEEEYRTLSTGMQELIFGMVRAQGIEIGEGVTLEDYHHLLSEQDEHHFAIAKWPQPLSSLPINPDLLTARISDLMGIPLVIKRLPDDNELVFGLRIVRPASHDENPFHRDAWQDCWRNSLNVWIPVVGCDANSTLAMVPGSHLWKESEVERTIAGARINGKQYHVPAVVAARRAFNPVKPNPGYTEALLFSPYLIHGGGANGNSDRTRVSMELRFQRKP